LPAHALTAVALAAALFAVPVQAQAPSQAAVSARANAPINTPANASANASANTPAKAQAASPPAAQKSAALPPKAKAAARPVSSKPARATAPKVPVAARNVAVGAAAVAAAPAALLSHGCLDGAHGRWLADELGAAAAGWPVPGLAAKEAAAGPVAPVVPAPPSAAAVAEAARCEAGEKLEPAEPSAAADAAAAQTAPALEGEGLAADSAVPPGAALARMADSGGCVPFASVRLPNQRIESLVLAPAAAPAAAEGSGDALQRRTVFVSRNLPAPLSVAAPRTASPQALRSTTGWREGAELPLATPHARFEVWLPVAELLSGDTGDVPARWVREVSLLVRQMKRQAEVERATWVRLVMSGSDEAARPAAVELVSDRGEALDSALWVERTELPSGFVGARGGDHERLLWQAPVDYQRISRGVGSAIVVTRKRVFAKPLTPGGKPRTVVRSFRTRGQHQGIDYVAPTGTPVVAVAEGTVEHVGPNGGYGNLVVLDHGGGITTYYAHLSAFGAGVQEGAKVERGQEIGLVGSTGRSTGPHLHYEIRKDGKYLDPADPKQTLPNWNLAADDHEAVLTQMLALSLSRPQEFAKATRPEFAKTARSAVPAAGFVPAAALRQAAAAAVSAPALAPATPE